MEEKYQNWKKFILRSRIASTVLLFLTLALMLAGLFIPLNDPAHKYKVLSTSLAIAGGVSSLFTITYFILACNVRVHEYDIDGQHLFVYAGFYTGKIYLDGTLRDEYLGGGNITGRTTLNARSKGGENIIIRIACTCAITVKYKDHIIQPIR